MAATKIKNYFVNPKNQFDYSRSVFRYERTHSTNLLTGAIVPVGFVKCLPGTTVPNKFGFVLQSAPLLGPTVDNIYIDIISAWCPSRLVMADFNEWLGDNDTYAWTLGNNIHEPKITKVNTKNPIPGNGTQQCSKTYFAEHYLGPHIGFRWFVAGSAASGATDFSATSGSGAFSADSVYHNGISVLHSRMYDLIYNRIFRNENITNPILFSKQSGTDLALDVTNYQAGLGQLHFANRMKDWINQAWISPSIETVTLGSNNGFFEVLPRSVQHSDGINLPSLHIAGASITAGTHAFGVTKTSGNTYASTYVQEGAGTGPTTANSYGFAPNNLWADLTSLTVNSLYYSIMLQKYMNKASTGRRPTEFYKTMFGISRSDAAHDDPQLLSQKRYKVNISRVVATGNSTDGQGNLQGLGTQGAFSVTSVGGVLFPEFTATEYGTLFVFAVIRTQESYASGIDKYLADHDLLSTYLPVFDHIGQEGVELLEVANLGYGGTTKYFGYQEAWYRYRYQVNDVVGVFSPGESLEYMTLARDFPAGYNGGNAFTINDAFIKQNPAEFDRMLQLPVFTGSGTVDANGEPYDSDRYQWVIQFALAGDLVATMSKDSEPLMFGSKI